MAKYLVIVESPAKVKTIKKFLGRNYDVDASGGHVRDLPKSRMGIDIENDYEPTYITIRGKGETLAALRKKAKAADKIFLATDPDREGEAISWHLYNALNLEGRNVARISFNEITDTAVKQALKNPREIDMDLVDAQQTRRILDRMVGYSISPLLWKKVKRGLSAGRVQSAALNMICEREEEIAAFIPAEYWSLEAEVFIGRSRTPVRLKYYGKKDTKLSINDRAQLDDILDEIKDEPFVIADVSRSERVKNPPLPFTTSTLQQEASIVLGFSTQKTMRIAQQLYEGVDVKGRGTIGLITYLRTDSTRISDEAKAAAARYISGTYGEEYLKRSERSAKTDERIQDAHEAIRPTDISLTPAAAEESLTRDQFRLYQLVWRRFTASRMAPAVYDNISLKADAGEHRFTASSAVLKKDGYLCVYTEPETKEKTQKLDLNLTGEEEIRLKQFIPEQHFTQPPAHYTEASLVKRMEEAGIGRPSTYAPTITTLISRRYIVKEKKSLYTTELGETVNGIMRSSFPSLVDVHFTAYMESLLDDISKGEIKWKTVVRNFYPDLKESVDRAEKELETVKIEDEVTDEICEVCGRNLVVKYGAYGKFLACPGFPDCRFTKPFYEKIGVSCPECGKDVVIKMSRKGRRYYGCIDNPDCKFMSWARPSDQKCPECGAYMIEKSSQLVCSDPDCGYSMKK